MTSLWLQTWTLVILTEPRLSKKYGTVVPMTQMTYKKEVSFPSPRGALRSTTDLPWRVTESLFPTEKEEHVIRFRWPQRGNRGWPATLSLENSLIEGLTGHCSLSSWQQRGGGEWCVAPWAPPLSPALPSSGALPRLTPGTLPVCSGSSCSWDSRTLSSPLSCWSCFCSLHSHYKQTARSTRPWHCGSTWLSCSCRNS